VKRDKAFLNDLNNFEAFHSLKTILKKDEKRFEMVENAEKQLQTLKNAEKHFVTVC
jgi:hypothetical protein